MDYYLKHQGITTPCKQNIVAASLSARKNGRPESVLIDDLSIVLTIDSKRSVDTTSQFHNDITQFFDCNFVCPTQRLYQVMLLRCCAILAQRKPHNKKPFFFYSMRVLRDWFTLHPHCNREEFFKLVSKAGPPAYEMLVFTKKEIYKRQNCEYCDSVPTQVCAVCNLTYYCSASCQQADWQIHRMCCFVEKDLFAKIGFPFLAHESKITS